MVRISGKLSARRLKHFAARGNTRLQKIRSRGFGDGQADGSAHVQHPNPLILSLSKDAPCQALLIRNRKSEDGWSAETRSTKIHRARFRHPGLDPGVDSHWKCNGMKVSAGVLNPRHFLGVLL
jgi:hypothetical protein